jgi:hypothetical protein
VGSPARAGLTSHVILLSRRWPRQGSSAIFWGSRQFKPGRLESSLGRHRADPGRRGRALTRPAFHFTALKPIGPHTSQIGETTPARTQNAGSSQSSRPGMGSVNDEFQATARPSVAHIQYDIASSRGTCHLFRCAASSPVASLPVNGLSPFAKSGEHGAFMVQQDIELDGASFAYLETASRGAARLRPASLHRCRRCGSQDSDATRPRQRYPRFSAANQPASDRADPLCQGCLHSERVPPRSQSGQDNQFTAEPDRRHPIGLALNGWSAAC